MKKAILLLLVLTVVSGSVFAIDLLSFPPPVDPGSVMIDLGIGLKYVSWSNWGTRMQVPPLWIQGEFALPVGVPISVGFGFAFERRVAEWLFYDDFAINFFTPHLRGNWHWNFPVSWLDFYTGLGFGVDIASWKYDFGYGVSASDTDVDFYWGIQVGTHFYFSQFVGAVVETGYPFYLKAGIAFKFGGQPSGSRSSSRSTGRASSSQSSVEYMLVNADTLNVRSGPSADTAAVGQVTRNTRVQVLDKSAGQWWRIRSDNNIEGYVNSSFLVAASQG